MSHRKQEIKAANKSADLPRGWMLLAEAYRQYRANWRMFVSISVIAAAPLTIFGLIPNVAADATYSTYSLLIGIAMNAALIYAAIRLLRDGVRTTTREAYYDGSALIVRCSLVALALGAMTLPVGLANRLYNIVAYADLPVEYAPVILIGLALVIILLIIPTVWLLTRYFAGLYVCAWEGLGPVAALRRGRALTLGRFWKVLGRLSVGALVAILIMILIALISIPVSMVEPETGPVALFNLIFSVFIQPIGILFLTNLYSALVADPAATPTAEPSVTSLKPGEVEE